MAATTTRELYLETGLAVLADSGYSALKLAEVCKRLGVTSGSFYHFFKNWSDYTSQVITHWYDSRTEAELAAARTEPDMSRRVDDLVQSALGLPHDAESAIRTWAAMDPEVCKVQEAADRARYDAALELLDDRVAAHRYANWALYLLTGYEQTTLPQDKEALKWAADQFTAALEREARRSRAERTTVDGQPSADVRL
ncbi:MULTISPECIES: TetR/AcrR family transcriptional regulator [Gordonia]|uniref:Helix-turn-helix domain-containing protein n=1 Tax=Gordonia amicalis TaxID=89053 RepID=A0AAE4R2W7_9ACTN|nr:MULTISPECIES: helix-turn-helix domain-containing protein [Gordonia]ATD72815.1 TetR/AcrR family transcriptional regulator [Gordonia sp. 1D]MBA5847524.1 helix-turn-helix transcriptional regulator [Gordonia amicalis]MCZ0911186.1 helix-turn-helix domain containing protein [Gordonia amicalis]MCZ4579483.1 helix-turn-helix domain containing protein [Gordonia amicalis]MCZ4653026.1 helix-turn-helix domain containing protein [Gordonia amicalis]